MRNQNDTLEAASDSASEVRMVEQKARRDSSELDLARRVLSLEAQTVSRLAQTVGEPFLNAVSLVVSCADAGGNVLVTGLGKSGLIGQKISATLASLGITSHFVHPAEAAHGDLGRFRASDLCIALSYSGETDEVVALCAILKQDLLPIIAITRGAADGAGPSSLERVASVTLAIGECDESSVSPAPTCSTTASLAIGDALALCAASRRNFTDDDFAKRHPGGSLGGLLRPVVEVLRFRVGHGLEPVPDHLSVGEALARADRPGLRRPGALLLVDESTGKLSGIFTDGDLRRLVLRSTDELARPVRDLMTRHPTTLTDAALVRDAVRLVRENRRDEIPVVDSHGRPVGILDVQDLIAMKLVKD